jgi:hypothetical protein
LGSFGFWFGWFLSLPHPFWRCGYVKKSTWIVSFGNSKYSCISLAWLSCATEQDPNDLAEKVLRVLCDDLLWERLRQNAHCPEQFLPNAVMEKIENL